MKTLRAIWPCLVILAVVIGFYLAVATTVRHRCEAKGGHVVGVYKGTICVSADGRVIE